MFMLVIEPSTQVSKPSGKTIPASVFLQICIGGSPVSPRVTTEVRLDGVILTVSPLVQNGVNRFGNNHLQFSSWGLAESSELMAIKPILPQLCKMLGEKLYQAQAAPPDAVDLVTDSLASQPVLEIKYKFTDVALEMVQATHSRIFFNCLVVPPTVPVQASANGLTVRLAPTRPFYTNHVFTFATMGWIETNVDTLRQEHSDAEIEAAFASLAQALAHQ
jgi:hypothetical protein